MSYGDPGEHANDTIGVSHRIVVRQVTPEPKPAIHLKGEVNFVCNTRIKEVVTPGDVLMVLESEFSEKIGEESPVSQEDLNFLSKLKEGIKHKQDGHYEMPLPFKEKYCSDYVNFMQDIIACGDAEKVPVEELDNQPAWYIPHHGVYHPQKPAKVCVVFDCSAKFQNTASNDHLLTVPEVTNTLMGVLCRFHKGQVATMCDVEHMFHQFLKIKTS